MVKSENYVYAALEKQKKTGIAAGLRIYISNI